MWRKTRRGCGNPARLRLWLAGAAGRPAAALILAANVRAVYRKYIVIGDSLCVW